MRRPVLYLAGLLMATGASLAFAGPASAAPSHNDHGHKCHHSHFYGDEWDNDSFSYHHEDNSVYGNGNTYNGINLLSGNIGGLL
jgi:hypothetical protein